MESYSPPENTRFVVTCEHGGNRVPARYVGLFKGREDVLNTHLAYDPGSLAVGRLLAKSLLAVFFHTTVTRLLVDHNRSLHHPRLFSQFSNNLAATAKKRLLAGYYLPHRQAVENSLMAAAKKEMRVIHIAVHSFTPVLDGITRQADVGLLYDPARSPEKMLCSAWKNALRELAPELRVRRNYPYAGRADGLASHLRRRFQEHEYIGVELELNQLLVPSTSKKGENVRLIQRSLAIAVRSLP